MSDIDNKELDQMLQAAFDASTKLYQERGFQRRVGFGKRPALVSVDLANAWTRPGNPFTCDQEKMDNEIIPAMQKLLKAFRAQKLPVVHVTTAYEITDRNAPFTDMGLWHDKIPVDVVDLADKDLWAIDSRIAPVDGEYTLLKKRASSFHGTELAGILRANNVDTILVTSFSTSFSEIVGSADAAPPNADAMFSITVLFHPLIIVGWTPYFLASSAVVSSSRMASSANLALNSAE